MILGAVLSTCLLRPGTAAAVSLRTTRARIRCLSARVPFTRDESASEAYAVEVSERPRSQDVLDAMTLYAETRPEKDAHMVSGDLQGGFLTMMARITKARTALDVGTFTGFSALSMAEGMDPDGHVTTLEREKVVADEAAKMFKMSRERIPDLAPISLIHGDAITTMKDMCTKGQTFDLCFIDANKKRYWEYYELLLKLLNPGGVMVFDNTLFRGQVMDPAARKGGIAASLDTFNRRLTTDLRSYKMLLPIRDGLTIVKKRD